MAWSEQRALNRIEKLRASAPVAALDVRDLEGFMAERRWLREAALARGERFEEPIFAVPLNQAVTTHGVHVYANLIDYNTHQTENGLETEASQARAMQFLHGHYGACDQLIAAFGIQRVDFHGARLHAVVLAPTGEANEGERLQLALAFAAAFRDMVARMSARYGAEFRTRVRIGIDTGPAVAINSGRRDELEPLFIGSPANHAAKAAAGDEEGIALTPRAQRVLQASQSVLAAPGRVALMPGVEEARLLDRRLQVAGRDASVKVRVDEAFAAFDRQRSAAIATAGGTPRAEFSFHYRQPPLRTLVYSEHPPSNAVRMPLVSLFADIAGFTDYIDQAIAAGAIAQAVGNLHVMRGEMNYVVRDDFDGRKLRYIGDCLQALIAEGDARTTDARASVRTAVLAAAGIRSSFSLCRALLPGVDALGIAIGLELGPTPIARLGLRGTASVRCASSRATCVSEEVQGACGANETGLGPVALAAADPHVQRLFAGGACARNLSYPAASALLLGASSVIPAPAAPLNHTSPRPMRAYRD